MLRLTSQFSGITRSHEHTLLRGINVKLKQCVAHSPGGFSVVCRRVLSFNSCSCMLKQLQLPLHSSCRYARRARYMPKYVVPGKGRLWKVSAPAGRTWPKVDSADQIGSNLAPESMETSTEKSDVGLSRDAEKAVTMRAVDSDETLISLAGSSQTLDFSDRTSKDIEPSTGHSGNNIIEVDTRAGEKVYSQSEELLIALKDMDPFQVLKTVSERHQELDKIQLAMCMKVLYKYFTQCAEHDSATADSFADNLRNNPWFKVLVVLVCGKARAYDAEMTCDVTLFLHDLGYTCREPQLQLFLQLLKHHLHELNLDQLVAIGSRVHGMPSLQVTNTLAEGLRVSIFFAFDQLMINEKQAQVTSLEPMEKFDLLRIWNDKLDDEFRDRVIQELLDECEDFRLDSNPDDLPVVLSLLVKYVRRCRTASVATAPEMNEQVSEINEHTLALSNDVLDDLECKMEQIKDIHYDRLLADLDTLWEVGVLRSRPGLLLPLADHFLANQPHPPLDTAVEIMKLHYDTYIFHAELAAHILESLSKSHLADPNILLTHISLENIVKFLIFLTFAPNYEDLTADLSALDVLGSNIQALLGLLLDKQSPWHQNNKTELHFMKKYSDAVTDSQCEAVTLIQSALLAINSRKKGFSQYVIQFQEPSELAFTTTDSIPVRRPMLESKCGDLIGQYVGEIGRALDARLILSNAALSCRKTKHAVKVCIFDHVVKLADGRIIAIKLVLPHLVIWNRNELNYFLNDILTLFHQKEERIHVLLVHHDLFFEMDEKMRFDWLKERIENSAAYQFPMYWLPDNVNKKSPAMAATPAAVVPLGSRHVPESILTSRVADADRDWTGAEEDKTDVNVWEDNWDDDNVEDDFSQQLRTELEKQGHKTAEPMQQ